MEKEKKNVRHDSEARTVRRKNRPICAKFRRFGGIVRGNFAAQAPQKNDRELKNLLPQFFEKNLLN